MGPRRPIKGANALLGHFEAAILDSLAVSFFSGNGHSTQNSSQVKKGTDWTKVERPTNGHKKLDKEEKGHPRNFALLWFSYIF